MKMSLACAAGIALIVGFGEGFDWVIPLFAILVGAVAVVLILNTVVGERSAAVSFHGHGNTYSETVAHERRHVRLLKGTGVGVAGRPKVWKNKDGNWEGVTYPGDEAKWNALSPAEQAAVFLAGSPSLGRNDDEYGVCDDLANADARASRSAARRIARKHLGWFA